MIHPNFKEAPIMGANQRQKKINLTACFLMAQAVLYIFILTAGGDLLVITSYLAILLCFAFAALHAETGNLWLLGGLACTAVADFFLVVCSPMRQLPGMVAFLGTQSLYAMYLHRKIRSRNLLYLRLGLSVLGALLPVLVLGSKADALAVISVCYYVNLILNIVMAFRRFRKNRMFAIALVLFLLCDTVVGLQAAAGAYLPIGNDSLLYRVIFVPFNLAWLFYLPSQVLIALCSRRKA